jgi:hypothetical protein
MIEKDYKSYQVICDNCLEGEEVDTWDEALEFMKENEWKKKKVDGKFLNYCADCKV